MHDRHLRRRRGRALRVLVAGTFVASLSLPALTHPPLEVAAGHRRAPPAVQGAGTAGSVVEVAAAPAFAPERAPSAAPQPEPAHSAPPRPRRAWKRRIDRLVAARTVGVAVAVDGKVIYAHRSKAMRRPASNQKLLLSMALLDRFGPRARIDTRALAASVQRGVVLGNLWIVGRGDPTVSGSARYARSLRVEPSYVGRLARRIAAAGISAIRGRVVGGTGYFRRDWNAPGWRSYYRAYHIALPTALSYNGNVARGRFIRDAERRLAAALTERLEARGVAVAKGPRAGSVPGDLSRVAALRSAPLERLLHHMNVTSSNFFAEVLGKRLGAQTYGRPGTIAKGARALAAYARRAGVAAVAYDSSGLSHANRLSTLGITRLLQHAAESPWGGVLRRSLARPGAGTLGDRLAGVRVRAKTGTLVGVSALSGWVWLRRRGEWAEFSILSSGLPKFKAMALEDAIVRTLEARAD